MQFASWVSDFPCEYFSLRLSVPSALDHNGPRHNIVHSPVVLEEEESDEDGEEESNGEVLIERSHCGPVKETQHGEGQIPLARQQRPECVLSFILRSLTLRGRRWTQEQREPGWAGPAWTCHMSPLAGRAETSPAWPRRPPRCRASDWTTSFTAVIYHLTGTKHSWSG